MKGELDDCRREVDDDRGKQQIRSVEFELQGLPLCFDRQKLTVQAKQLKDNLE